MCRRAECRFASVVGPGIWSAWLWESPAIGLRVARGSIAMNETTPTASSHGASPWVETYPPVERAASLGGLGCNAGGLPLCRFCGFGGLLIGRLREVRVLWDHLPSSSCGCAAATSAALVCIELVCSLSACQLFRLSRFAHWILMLPRSGKPIHMRLPSLRQKILSLQKLIGLSSFPRRCQPPMAGEQTAHSRVLLLVEHTGRARARTSLG